MNSIVRQIQSSSLQPARQTPRGWEKEYVFEPSFLGFQGHFPDMPILPAVVQIMIFREAIADQLGQAVEVSKITRAKFIKTITAKTPILAIWTIKDHDASYHCECIIEIEGQKASSFNLTLSPRPQPHA